MYNVQLYNKPAWQCAPNCALCVRVWTLCGTPSRRFGTLPRHLTSLTECNVCTYYYSMCSIILMHSVCTHGVKSSMHTVWKCASTVCTQLCNPCALKCARANPCKNHVGAAPQGPILTPRHIHIHTFIHIFTYIYTHIHIYIHIHTASHHGLRQVHAPINVPHAYTHRWTHISPRRTHSHTHTHTHTHTRARTHTHMHHSHIGRLDI